MARFTKFQSSTATSSTIPTILNMRRVVEVALLPGVSYEEALGWLTNVDVQLINEDVLGVSEIRKFLIYEKGVRDKELRSL